MFYSEPQSNEATYWVTIDCSWIQYNLNSTYCSLWVVLCGCINLLFSTGFCYDHVVLEGMKHAQCPH
jgi:hypothetical protein